PTHLRASGKDDAGRFAGHGPAPARARVFHSHLKAATAPVVLDRAEASRADGPRACARLREQETRAARCRHTCRRARKVPCELSLAMEWCDAAVCSERSRRNTRQLLHRSAAP